jgi:hypothetical protein
MKRYLLLSLIFTSLLSPFHQPAALTSRSLDRDLDPVIMTGAALPDLAGVAFAQLFGYAYQGGLWRQIPLQFDDVVGGKVVAAGNGKLDAVDQIVFMAADAGDQAPIGSWIDDADSQQHPRTEITVTDPTDPAKRGWVYLYRSATLVNTVTGKYVTFDAAQALLTTDRYQLRLPRGRLGPGFLKLNGSDTNIMDRAKMRVQLLGGMLVTEATFDMSAPTLVKSGSVRTILATTFFGGEATRLIAYRAQYQWMSDINLSGYGIRLDWVRFSADFSPAMAGSTYYDQNTPAGVTVDGVPDSVAASPASAWFQISGATGTLIVVTELSAMGGTAATYYKDDAATDGSDTGDLKSYGDAGVRINRPEPRLKASIWEYMLPAGQANVGAQYHAYALQALQAEGQSQQVRSLYLPWLHTSVNP